ncbi:MAG: hypothetical protein R3C11_01165 [Planctomycetaceae bacterium]
MESLRTHFAQNRQQRRILKRHRTEHKQIPAAVEKLEERLLLSVTSYDVTADMGDTNSAVVGDVTPTSIDHNLIPEQTVTDTVTLNFDNESQIPTADIIFVVDESGSMVGEHAWIVEMASDLEESLNCRGLQITGLHWSATWVRGACSICLRRSSRFLSMTVVELWWTVP